MITYCTLSVQVEPMPTVTRLISHQSATVLLIVTILSPGRTARSWTRRERRTRRGDHHFLRKYIEMIRAFRILKVFPGDSLFSHYVMALFRTALC